MLIPWRNREGRIVKRRLKVTDHQKRLLTIPLPGKTARAFREGVLTCPENGYGKVRWEEFLSERIRVAAYLRPIGQETTPVRRAGRRRERQRERSRYWASGP
jgi:hypothetical protein